MTRMLARRPRRLLHRVPGRRSPARHAGGDLGLDQQRVAAAAGGGPTRSSRRALPRATRLGRVESIEPGMGDRHHGGRRVMALALRERASAIVYKPRDVGTRAGVERVRRLGAAPREWTCHRRSPCSTVDGYGWVEFARFAELANVEQVRRYFRRAGALVCLAHVLRGRDLHMENVVATTEGPQLVDTEMLLQPESSTREGATDGDSAAGPSVQESCLGSGLALAAAERRSGRPVRHRRSARHRQRPRAARAPRLERARHRRHPLRARGSLRADRRQPCRARRPAAAAGRLRGGRRGRVRARLPPAARAQGRLLARRGPARRASRGRPVRVLLRTSTQYGALQYVLTSPQYQRSGLRRSFAMDSLNRCFAREQRAAADVAAGGRRAPLARALDIPRFTRRLERHQRAQRVRRATVDGWFARSGFSSVMARVRALGEDDLALQAEFLAGALANPVDARFDTPAPSAAAAPAAGRSRTDSDRARVRGSAVSCCAAPRRRRTARAGRRRRTRGSRSGIGPLRLYDGASGPALFLAALGALSGEAEFRDAARAALASVAAQRRQVCCATTTRSGARPASAPSPTRSAWPRTSSTSPRCCSPRSSWPAASASDASPPTSGSTWWAGTAGAALSLLALHRLSGEELARRSCGRLRSAPRGRGRGARRGRARVARGGRPAARRHGTRRRRHRLRPGAGRSAQRRASGCSRPRARAAPTSAACSLRPSATGPSSAAAGSGGPSLMAAWCHGAPGHRPRARALAGPARRAVAARGRRGRDGDQRRGRAARQRPPLLRPPRPGGGAADGGLQLGRTPWIEAARACALQVAARARADRRFSLPSSEFECRPYHPGFFRGLAGVGYQLLRMAAPAQVPSVLGWQAPERVGDRR